MDASLTLIEQHYHLELIDSQRYLVNKHNGHISSLNPSASILFDLLTAGLSVSEAITAIADSTKQRSADISATINPFINDILAPEKSEAYPPTYLPAATTSLPAPSICACYEINQRCIEVRYGSQALFEENHALLEPMHRLSAAGADHRIDIIETDDGTDLYVDGAALLGTEDSSWVNGLLRSSIIQLAYPDLKQPMVLHAAGLCRDDKAVLFTGPSGAGKSTLSAHFMLNGFDYLGDDTIPLDMHSNTAFSLPTALSLKRGSWELFDAYKQQLAASSLRREFDKPMKMLTPAAPKLSTHHGSIKALIFSCYSPTATNSLTPIDLDTALNLIQTAETKFNPDTISTAPREMLHWLNRVPKYNMNYNHLDYATTSVLALLR